METRLDTFGRLLVRARARVLRQAVFLGLALVWTVLWRVSMGSTDWQPPLMSVSRWLGPVLVLGSVWLTLNFYALLEERYEVGRWERLLVTVFYPFAVGAVAAALAAVFLVWRKLYHGEGGDFVRETAQAIGFVAIWQGLKFAVFWLPAILLGAGTFFIARRAAACVGRREREGLRRLGVPARHAGLPEAGPS